jgi:hypothetical protein
MSRMHHTLVYSCPVRSSSKVFLVLQIQFGTRQQLQEFELICLSLKSTVLFLHMAAKPSYVPLTGDNNAIIIILYEISYHPFTQPLFYPCAQESRTKFVNFNAWRNHTSFGSVGRQLRLHLSSNSISNSISYIILFIVCSFFTVFICIYMIQYFWNNNFSLCRKLIIIKCPLYVVNWFWLNTRSGFSDVVISIC